ncbi:MAG TPA: porin [Gammaproteobacteria bacterium]|nr:porin [Gammaproteobacteria bacterium]
MKKQLMGISAVLAVCGWPFAASSADLVLYGTAYAELAAETTNEGSTEQRVETLDDRQGFGRIGLRFSQSLSSDWVVFGLYEWQMDVPSGEQNFEARDAFIGLSSDYGSLALGRFNGVYKTTGGINFDPFVFTSLQARGNGGMSTGPFGTTGFVSHAIQYRAPVWQPDEDFQLEAAVQYVVGEDTTATEADGSPGSYLAGLQMTWQAATLIAATSHNDATGASNSKLGVRITEGDISYLLQHETVETGGFDAAGIGTYIFAGVQYRAGKALYVLQAGDYNSDTSDGNAGYFALGVRYSLADNVQVYGGYRSTDSDVAALSSSSLSLGLRYDF